MKNIELYSHTITHDLFIFEGVRECFAFAKPHKPTEKLKFAKELAKPAQEKLFLKKNRRLKK